MKVERILQFVIATSEKHFQDFALAPFAAAPVFAFVYIANLPIY